MQLALRQKIRMTARQFLDRRRPLRKRIFAGAAALSAIAFSAQAFAAETKVALCEYCNSAAFRNAAEVTALAEPPQLHEGAQHVFVVDIGTDEIRYYEVVRENVEICQSSQTSATSMSTLDPNDPGPEVPECFSNRVTSSTQLAPPADELAEIRDALHEVNKFLAEIRDLDAGDLDFGLYPIDSATDLIGPDGLPDDPYDVSEYRNTFMTVISNSLTDSLWERIYWDTTTLPAAAMAKYLGQVAQGIKIDVIFPDGTQISVELTRLFRDESGNVSGFEMEIVSGSDVFEDGISVLPVTTGGFVDLFGNPYTGNAVFVENLSDLFMRGGGRVESDQSTGRSDRCLTCQCVNRPLDQGGLDRVCEVTSSKPERWRC
jgi:hypothetical protein